MFGSPPLYMTCLWRSLHFMKFLAKIFLWKLTPTPCGQGLANMTFLYRSKLFMPIIGKKCWYLSPHLKPHPYGDGGWKSYFSVKIWIFHFIPSKKFIFGNWCPPYPLRLRFGNMILQMWTFHAISSKERMGLLKAFCVEGLCKASLIP